MIAVDIDVAAEVQAWNHVPTESITEPTWSSEQFKALTEMGRRVLHDDDRDDAARPLFLCGDPGKGKSELLVHAAHRAAHVGMNALLMCPTGTLVHAYRERLPAHVNITVESPLPCYPIIDWITKSSSNPNLCVYALSVDGFLVGHS